jgi:hypothetical protein
MTSQLVTYSRNSLPWQRRLAEPPADRLLSLAKETFRTEASLEAASDHSFGAKSDICVVANNLSGGGSGCIWRE